MKQSNIWIIRILDGEESKWGQSLTWNINGWEFFKIKKSHQSTQLRSLEKHGEEREARDTYAYHIWIAKN